VSLVVEQFEAYVGEREVERGRLARLVDSHGLDRFSDDPISPSGYGHVATGFMPDSPIVQRGAAPNRVLVS